MDNRPQSADDAAWKREVTAKIDALILQLAAQATQQGRS